ncbi:MAG TPA: sulfite exporter TauE/SafE family protein, partial [Burkholderiales bacterium]|nr:sulfite exporter TauE/SafE family protein [Burkholderiales bacterium]
LLGIASGVHCVGMCGGFVAAFNGIPIRKVETRRWRRLALFNAGRITSYCAAGALAGFLGGQLTFALGAQTVLYVAANLLLVLIGLHLAGAFSGIEKIGLPLWRRLQPHAARAMGGNAYVAGLFWGWLPCGLVYAALALAALAGGAAAGAAAMAAYGIGTLPWLLAAGAAFAWLQKRMVRAVAGGAVLAFGVYGLAHATSMAGGIRAVLCI